MIHFFYALLFSGAIAGAASICEKYIASYLFTGGKARINLLFASDLSFFMGLTFFTALVLVTFSDARWRHLGIRMPTGKDWWLLLPPEISVFQSLSWRFWISTQATGRNVLPKNVFGLRNSNPVWVDHGSRSEDSVFKSKIEKTLAWRPNSMIEFHGSRNRKWLELFFEQINVLNRITFIQSSYFFSTWIPLF